MTCESTLSSAITAMLQERLSADSWCPYGLGSSMSSPSDSAGAGQIATAIAFRRPPRIVDPCRPRSLDGGLASTTHFLLVMISIVMTQRPLTRAVVYPGSTASAFFPCCLRSARGQPARIDPARIVGAGPDHSVQLTGTRRHSPTCGER